jgi:hypothetical protein
MSAPDLPSRPLAELLARTGDRRRLPTEVNSFSATRFSISSLLLTTALIGVCLALGRVAPLLGVAFALVAGPAYIRTVLAPRELVPGAAADSLSLTTVAAVLVFAESLALVVMLIGLAAGSFCGILIAFVSIGITLERIGAPFQHGALLVSLITGFALALVTGIGLPVWAGLRLWPVRITRRRWLRR